MEHLNKMLEGIKNNSKLFQDKEINFTLGLTNTQVKDLKKFAISEQLIKEHKREFTLTQSGEEYLSDNPIESWV